MNGYAASAPPSQWSQYAEITRTVDPNSPEGAGQLAELRRAELLRLWGLAPLPVTDEGEVTPEMIAAGVAELVRFDREWEIEADAVERIFVAMIEARRG